MGHKTYFMSKLPPNQLGDGAITHLLSNGVDTNYVVRGSTTIGIYFLETGFGGRPSKVIYNRKHSAITRVDESEFDWVLLVLIILGVILLIIAICLCCKFCCNSKKSKSKKKDVKIDLQPNETLYENELLEDKDKDNIN